MNKINIIYPPLIEEAYQFYQEEGIIKTKQEIFHELVAMEIIDQNGYPTDKALENGIIQEFAEKANLSLEEFKQIYPIFSRYDDKYFIFKDGFWEISDELSDLIQQDIHNHLFSEQELTEIEAYFDLPIEDQL